MNSSMDVPSEQRCYKVDGIVRHKGFVYEQDRTDIANDIALVHLAEPVNMTREISPVCLPTAGAVKPAGTLCFVTGWGDEKGIEVIMHFSFMSLSRYSRNQRSLQLEKYIHLLLSALTVF